MVPRKSGEREREMREMRERERERERKEREKCPVRSLPSLIHRHQGTQDT